MSCYTITGSNARIVFDLAYHFNFSKPLNTADAILKRKKPTQRSVYKHEYIHGRA